MKSIELYKHFPVIILLLLLTQVVNAQSLRSLNNEGVDLYKDGKYAESEISFKKGNEKEPGYITTFNLGDAYYKQQRYEEAIKTYQSALTLNDDKEFKSRIYHNIGNSYLKSQKLDESIKSYKEALKLNPYDEETKYNLSYALSMKKNEQQNQQQKNDQDKNDQQKDKEQNQDNEDKNDQQKIDDNKGKNNDEKKPDQNQTTQQDNLKQPQQNKISKEEAERILNALKNNEQDLQKKLRKQKGTPVKTEKDW